MENPEEQMSAVEKSAAVKRQIYAMLKRGERDPAYQASRAALMTAEDWQAGLHVIADALQNAPELEVRRLAAAMMFQLDQGSQNVAGQ